MLLMLSSPILLLTIAHILFPTRSEHENLKEYYFSNPVLPWRLAGATVILGTLFRPIAFGMPLFVRDNASALPMILICVLLGSSRNRTVHYVFVPCLLFSYSWTPWLSVTKLVDVTGYVPVGATRDLLIAR